MLRRAFLTGAALAATLASPVVVKAGDHGTADEAKALCEKAVADLKENGPDKAFAVFNDPHGSFIDRDLYVFVRSLDGNTVAHGANIHMIGHTNLSLRDADGKLYN
ncbi:MAG TPA: hypothetical protein VHX39_01550, partial [Acetobacteraceae bacterium]|nr:hypothetical protein [Acetobacteraceae bacterium]